MPLIERGQGVSLGQVGHLVDVTGRQGVAHCLGDQIVVLVPVASQAVQGQQSIVRNERMPSHQELGVECAPYLNGLGEAIQECRRHILDVIRQGKIEQGERILQVMDDAYYLLVTFDYPDAVTGGLRRTTDMVRSVLERTRGDLTVTIREQHLEQSIQAAIGRLTDERSSGQAPGGD